MSKKGAYVYQQIEQTTAEWAVDTTVYGITSVFLFERLENGKVNMKLSDGVHTFAELPYVMQDVKVAVKTNNATTYILTVTTAEGEFDTPNLRGKDAPAPSIDPETKHWKIGEEDTGIVAEGKNGISVSVVENSENTETVYKLDITDKDGKKTTPNLRGTDAPIPSIDPVTKQWKIGDKDTGVVAEGKNAAITDDAPSDGKTYGRKDGLWKEIVENNQYLGLDVLFDEEGNPVSVVSEEFLNAVIDAETKHVMIGTMQGSNVIVYIIAQDSQYDIYISRSVLGGNVSTEVNNDQIIETYYFGISTYDRSVRFGIGMNRFNNTGDGTKYLSDNGAYLTPPNATPTTAGYMSAEDKQRVDDAVVFKDVTVAATLTGLSIANYSIKVSLSSASALSFASTPYEGWECMIDIKNTGSSDITQALPNATGWQCDETSMTIAAGKIASISVRYVHGTYVVLAKGN